VKTISPSWVTLTNRLDVARSTVSHKSGRNTGTTQEEQHTLVGRLRSWASQDSVQELTDEEEHPDGWLIEALGEVFEKDSETIESLKQSLLDQLPADEAIPTVMTVRMKLDSNTLEGPVSRERIGCIPRTSVC